MVWVILFQIIGIDTLPRGWISWACVVACEVSEGIFILSVSCFWLGGFIAWHLPSFAVICLFFVAVIWSRSLFKGWIKMFECFSTELHGIPFWGCKDKLGWKRWQWLNEKPRLRLAEPREETLECCFTLFPFRSDLGSRGECNRSWFLGWGNETEMELCTSPVFSPSGYSMPWYFVTGHKAARS